MGGGPAHTLLDEHEHYSAGVGFAMLFNLIVGAGALALPKACGTGGRRCCRRVVFFF